MPVKESICLNTAKPVYKGLHDQIVPDQLKLRCKIITRNSIRKQLQENITEYEKSSIFGKDCRNVSNNIPKDIHSEKSFSAFKDKS